MIIKVSVEVPEYVYSKAAVDVANTFGECQVLPTVVYYQTESGVVDTCNVAILVSYINASNSNYDDMYCIANDYAQETGMVVRYSIGDKHYVTRDW